MNVSKLLHELELKLFAFDHIRCGREWNYPQVVSPFARPFHVLSGEAVIHYAGRDWPLRPGQLVLAPPFTPVDYRCAKEFENYYAIFTCHTRTGLDFFTLGTFAGSLAADALTGPLFQRLLELNPGCGLRQVDPRRPNYNSAIWAADPEQRLLPENLLATDGIMRLLLAPFVGSFRLHTSGGEAGGRFLPVLQHMGEHLQQPLTLHTLAAIAHLQPTYFSDAFQAETGLRPILYLTCRRIERAQLLLLSTPKPMKEIAAACGFPDANYFFRVFRRHVGMTPSDYRRQLL